MGVNQPRHQGLAADINALCISWYANFVGGPYSAHTSIGYHKSRIFQRRCAGTVNQSGTDEYQVTLVCEAAGSKPGEAKQKTKDYGAREFHNMLFECIWYGKSSIAFS
jgi:hypothetical protein